MSKTKVAILVLVVFGAVAYFEIKNVGESKRSEATVSDESEAEREESMRSAFAPSANGTKATVVSDDPQLVAELQEFFEQLGKAYNNGDRSRVFELFSPEQLLAYSEKSGVVDISDVRGLSRSKFRREFVKGMKDGLGSNIKTNGFSNPRIQKIEKIRDGEVIAYVRAHGDFLEISTKMRYWLLKNSDGRWQAYDYEDLEQSLRVSSLMGALLTSDGDAAPWTMEFVALVQGLRGLAGDDPEGALALIGKNATKLLKNKLPEDIEGFALTMRSASSLADNDTSAALADLDAAAKLMPGAPGIFYQRGECLRLEEKYEQALAEFQKYVDVLGWDEDVRESFSDCNFQLGDIEKSLEHAEKGLEENPNSLGCVASFAIAAPESRRGEIRNFVKKTEDVELTYATIIDYAMAIEADSTRDYVLGLLAEDVPKSDLIEFYQAEIGGGETGDE